MEMLNDSNTKQLQEFTTCTICLKKYKDPRILPCSHTFCLKCLHQSVKDGKFSCPMKDDIMINENDIDQLPINRTAKDTVDFVVSLSPSLDEKTYYPCENCNEKQALNWCEKCATNLCDTCTKSVHSIKIFQAHTIVSLSNKIYSFCLEHPDEKFKYWCTQCHLLVCRDCLLFKHKDHTFVSLDDAAMDAKGNLERKTQEINEIKRNLTQFSTTTKNAIERQREIARHEMQDTAQTFANLQQMLEERKCILTKELKDEEIQSIKILNQQQINIDQHLNLTTVQELCIRQILNSDDPIQILKFKSTLSHNYNEFIEKYRKIDEGCIIMRDTFKRNDKDLEDLQDMISKLGSITSKAHVVKKDGVAIRTIPLDISKISDSSNSIISKEQNIARGYKFSLKQPMKLRSIRIQSDHIGQVIGFVVNDANTVIQKSIINSVNATMKWLIIPMEFEIKDNYGVLILPPSDNGSYTYKNGDNQFRKITENCSVKSKLCNMTTQLNIGLQLTVINNTHSISMIIDVEE
ncbi:unnamed protein product [Adineta steineri]|uniref:TRIM56 n=1 Tax=Adineta steineri TaxID=433720 RepID=A0A814GQH0_9BILA|nr:unnamed protein product [Adineta steineri]CAF1440269.1 unnamed protein product [Adineta steineri]